MAESGGEKVIPTSDNAAYGTSHERIVGPQSDIQEYEVPYLEVIPSSGNAAYGTSHERRVVPQSDVQEYEVPSLDLQPHSSAVEEPVYEGMS